ncbi:hypothetical protein MCOR27_007496 [Pyricularia oryzae]|uniref:Uncharacterized protein n=1 Tax=Pyricularia grisea TaxID=148305 RepID=A0ABQ8P017_PYRGI|nr:hypothetical protein MCOR01_008584 [Pyricularia oryzae]KAI6304019.1 hypothetical protein MCOR33_000999 [Pyricularia grisea]KAI6274171.1 hypothetical protein MCOR27_007496 [Pyricularia oryzae]KAI6362987.1 hypothetical protein MCOR32_008335 [Pyricularia oryzae]KAI6394862.1 hypothetical protein MCOR23_007342 [Pyricularia oryzae]
MCSSMLPSESSLNIESVGTPDDQLHTGHSIAMLGILQPGLCIRQLTRGSSCFASFGSALTFNQPSFAIIVHLPGADAVSFELCLLEHKHAALHPLPWALVLALDLEPSVQPKGDTGQAEETTSKGRHKGFVPA